MTCLNRYGFSLNEKNNHNFYWYTDWNILRIQKQVASWNRIVYNYSINDKEWRPIQNLVIRDRFGSEMRWTETIHARYLQFSVTKYGNRHWELTRSEEFLESLIRKNYSDLANIRDIRRRIAAIKHNFPVMEHQSLELINDSCLHTRRHRLIDE